MCIRDRCERACVVVQIKWYTEITKMRYNTTKPNESSANGMDRSEFDEEDGTDEGMYARNFKNRYIRLCCMNSVVFLSKNDITV